MSPNNSTLTPTGQYSPTLPGTATGISVLKSGTTLSGNIINSGSINANTIPGRQIGINIGEGATNSINQNAGAVLNGSITNSGTITSQVGVWVAGNSGLFSTVTGSIINAASGQINYTNVGINEEWATIGGSITNSGTITGTGTGGINVAFANVGSTGTPGSGNVVNATGAKIVSGYIGIVDNGNSGSAIGATIAGSIINNGNITVPNQGTAQGIEVAAAAVLGGVTNTGTINGALGVVLFGANSGGFPKIASVGGNIVNQGMINAVSTNGSGGGIEIFGDKGGGPAIVGGSIVNSGTISVTGVSGSNDGIFLAGAHVAGGITNSSTISVGGGTVNIGIAVAKSSGANFSPANSSIGGSIVNLGSITAGTGILVSGGSVIIGGITNSGNISGSNAAINVTGEGAATTINQKGGTITGNILLSGLGDTVNVTGGAIAGNITAPARAAPSTSRSAPAPSAIPTPSRASAAVNVNSGTLFDNSSIAATLVSINGGTLAPGQPGSPGTLSVTGSLVFASAATYMITINGANASQDQCHRRRHAGRCLGQGGERKHGHFRPDLYDPDRERRGDRNVQSERHFRQHDRHLDLRCRRRVPELRRQRQQDHALAAAGIAAERAQRGGRDRQFPRLRRHAPARLPEPVQLHAAATGERLDPAFGRGRHRRAGERLPADELVPGAADGAGGRQRRGRRPRHAVCARARASVPSDVALAYASVLKAPPKAVPHWTTWAAAFGGTNSTSGDPTGVGSHDMTAHAGAVAAGADYHVSPDTIVGFSLAGGGSSWGLSAGLGGGRSDAFLAGLYGSKRWDQAYLSGALTYSSYWMSTNRTVTVFGPDSLNASFNAQNFGGRLEGGYVAWSMPFRVIPYAAVQAQSFHAPAYGETGSLGAPDPSALSFAAQTATVVRAELGSRFDQIFAQADGGSLDLFGRPPGRMTGRATRT